MSINLNSRNNTLCCKVNDLYTALMASELLNDCVEDVVEMLKTCVDYVNIVTSQEVQIQHARFTMDGEEFDNLPLYIAGEWVKDEFERYHNFYAVFEQDAAL